MQNLQSRRKTKIHEALVTTGGVQDLLQWDKLGMSWRILIVIVIVQMAHQ